MSDILVTGANGFIGQHLCDYVSKKGHHVRCATRLKSTRSQAVNIDSVTVGNIDSTTDWSQALRGIDCVVHLAARAHILKESAADPLANFLAVNTYGTERLARQAAEAGVRRFIYISSLKASADATAVAPLLETDLARPQDPYGRSKLAAEARLLLASRDSQLEAVIIRPPLVYGPGVGANFLRMMDVVYKRIPLPLRSVANRRSLVSVYNLCDLIATCIEHPAAVGERFYVSDGEDVSTPELLVALGDAMNRRTRLLPWPPRILQLMFKMIGRPADFGRLCGSLHVSIEKARTVLDWSPVMSLDEGLTHTVDWYYSRNSKASI